MKNTPPLNFHTVISIRVAVKLAIRDTIKARRQSISVWGIGSPMVKHYNGDIRDYITAYRASASIPVTY